MHFLPFHCFRYCHSNSFAYLCHPLCLGFLSFPCLPFQCHPFSSFLLQASIYTTIVHLCSCISLMSCIPSRILPCDSAHFFHRYVFPPFSFRSSVSHFSERRGRFAKTGQQQRRFCLMHLPNNVANCSDVLCKHTQRERHGVPTRLVRSVDAAVQGGFRRVHSGRER